MRYVSGLSQRALEIAVEDLGFNSETDEAKWRFKRLRQKRSDPHKTSVDRPWSLVDRIAERLPACEASRAFYRADLWDWLLGNVPRLEELHERIERDLGERGYFRPTAEQAKLFCDLIPESTEFSWNGHYALEWELHRWGDSIQDLSLASGLVLEASLSRNWDVVTRWGGPLKSHIEAFKRQPWLRSVHGQQEAQHLGEQIMAVFFDSPKGASKPVDHFISGIVSSPIVGLHGDAVWFLQWERELRSALSRGPSDLYEEGSELARLLAKRRDYAIKKRKGAIYMNFHRKERK